MKLGEINKERHQLLSLELLSQHHLVKFSNNIKMKLFRAVVDVNRTDWVVINNLAQDSMFDTHAMRVVRWKVDPYRSEIKQVLGIISDQRDHKKIALLVRYWPGCISAR